MHSLISLSVYVSVPKKVAIPAMQWALELKGTWLTADIIFLKWSTHREHSFTLVALKDVSTAGEMPSRLECRQTSQ